MYIYFPKNLACVFIFILFTWNQLSDTSVKEKRKDVVVWLYPSISQSRLEYRPSINWNSEAEEDKVPYQRCSLFEHVQGFFLSPKERRRRSIGWNLSLIFNWNRDSRWRPKSLVLWKDLIKGSAMWELTTKHIPHHTLLYARIWPQTSNPTQKGRMTVFCSSCEGEEGWLGVIKLRTSLWHLSLDWLADLPFAMNKEGTYISPKKSFESELQIQSDDRTQTCRNGTHGKRIPSNFSVWFSILKD